MNRCVLSSNMVCLDADKKYLDGICKGCSEFNRHSEEHGHPKFYQLCDEEKILHSQKNYDYAHGGDPLGNFKRVSTILSLYPHLDLTHPATIAVVYMMKQFDAILWMLSQQYEPKIENIFDKLRDISIYAKLIHLLLEEKTINRKDPT